MKTQPHSGQVRSISARVTLASVVRLRNLRRLRERRALSQKDLAALSGVTDRTIRNLETGETESRPSTTRKLARALHVKVEELMGPEETD
jgi:transcriptional regulator with XRE-family HTH domain